MDASIPPACQPEQIQVLCLRCSALFSCHIHIVVKFTIQKFVLVCAGSKQNIAVCSVAQYNGFTEASFSFTVSHVSAPTCQHYFIHAKPSCPTHCVKLGSPNYTQLRQCMQKTGTEIHVRSCVNHDVHSSDFHQTPCHISRSAFYPNEIKKKHIQKTGQNFIYVVRKYVTAD